MPNYNVKYIRPANMLLCLRDELNDVFPGRFTGTDGFVSGYGIFGTSAHNANDKGHCMAFDFSTTVGQMIDEPTGRALCDYLRTKKNDFFSYLIHDMGPVAAEPRIAGNRTKWQWVEYDGPQHADHGHLSLTEDYKWGDSCGLSQTIYDRVVYWGIKEWYAAYKNGGVSPVKPIGAKEVKHKTLQPPANTRRLGKNSPWFLKDSDGKTNTNYACLGVGLYDIDLFIQGHGLPVGETIEVQFFLVKDGKLSGYYTQQVHGTASGEYRSPGLSFKRPLSGVKLEVSVKSSCDTAFLSVYGADVSMFLV